MTEASCKRCSVVRVNILCDLYAKANEAGEQKARNDLGRLVRLAGNRGYAEGSSLLQPGLDAAEARPLCWNVSSVLSDGDLEALGYRIK